MSRAPRPLPLRFHPATPSRWVDIERLLGERGGCGGCWCMAWRLSPTDWKAGKGVGNRRLLRRLVHRGGVPGILGYLGREPVAWCAMAPRRVYSFLHRSRVLRPVDDHEVWSISCLYVSKEHRRRGISRQILRAAVAYAGKRGAAIVEGYPTVPFAAKTPDPFLWTGTVSAFRKAGFVEVARRSKSRPIMRCPCDGERETRRSRVRRAGAPAPS
ncbi:MAG TPA: GNAT family N-acetyltransferase [Candidatus Polarisedimenticolia bacterium]|nr:GNAT family N-acetyltransferase [Candidatus Polarisedimenticolia bacterium]